MDRKYAILILAAGKSSRMKACKLELSYGGKTMLEHTLDAACSSDAKHVIVISGAFPTVVEKAALHYDVDVLENFSFETGMASSIQLGISYIQHHYEVEGVIISVADQFYLNSGVFNDLMANHRMKMDHIIVSAYQNTIGVPCLFPTSKLGFLDEISGDSGAKKVLVKYRNLLGEIPFPKGWLDLDTPSDLIDLDLDIDKTDV